MSRYEDYLRFLRSWAGAPSRVAAIAPSGQALARLITSEIHPEKGPVLELGAGTGVFTDALLERGLPERELTLVEYGTDFVPVLRERFPAANVYHGDAARLGRLDLMPAGSAGGVVSGLGLLAMSPRQVIMVLTGAFRYLRPHGAMYQFTYGPRCPVPRPILDRLGLKAQWIGATIRNLPPASVYRISRRGSARSSRAGTGTFSVAPGVSGGLVPA